MGNGCARGCPEAPPTVTAKAVQPKSLKAQSVTEQETTGVAVDMSRPFINDHRVSDVVNNKH